MGKNPRGSAERRKKAIVAILKKIKPNVVLVQEFYWVGIVEGTWEGYDFPEYNHVGNFDACILYEKNLNFKVLQNIEINNFVKEKQKRWKRHVSPCLTDRMCLGVVNVPEAHFLCVSWHGQYVSLDEVEKISNLRNLIDCTIEIANLLKVPFIIGGDFNLPLKMVGEILKQQRQQIQICYDRPQPMRTANLVDFFITSKTLPLCKINAIKWEKVDGASVEDIFTHDSIVATLTRAPEPPANVQ